MRTRRLAAGFAAILALLGATGTVLAVTGTLDQQHECTATHCNTSAYYPTVNAPVAPGSTDVVTLAQAFTAGVTGNLTDVSLYGSVLTGDGVTYPSSLTVAVVDLDGVGNPEIGAPLGTVDVPLSDLPAPGATQSRPRRIRR